MLRAGLDHGAFSTLSILTANGVPLLEGIQTAAPPCPANHVIIEATATAAGGRSASAKGGLRAALADLRLFRHDDAVRRRLRRTGQRAGNHA
ncbi:hypothetical protein DMI70_06140 [Escherichia coli]|nr:hypothetical protein [Escherichia coli]